MVMVTRAGVNIRVIGQFPCILPECPTTGVLERSLCPDISYSTAEQLEPSYKLFPATDKAQIEWWLSLHSSTRCQTTLMLRWLQLDSPWTPCRVHTQLRLSCMYICSWHDGSIKSENVVTKSFMLCHLLILTSVMWLAQQALDLSFYVVARHNDRQVLNNYFEPCKRNKLRTVIRPAVQLLQIQEVRTWPHSNVQFASCLHPIFSTGSNSTLLYFCDSKQRPTERTTLVLFIHSCFINRRLT